MSTDQSSLIVNQHQQNYIQKRKEQLLQGLIVPRSIEELNKFDKRNHGVTISSGFIATIKYNKFLESQHFMFFINLLNHVYKGKRVLAFDFYVFCDFMPNLVKQSPQYQQKQREQLQYNQKKFEIERKQQTIQQQIIGNTQRVDSLRELIDQQQEELAILLSQIHEKQEAKPQEKPQESQTYSVWGKNTEQSQSEIIQANQDQKEKIHTEQRGVKSEIQIKKLDVTSNYPDKINNEDCPDFLQKAGPIQEQICDDQNLLFVDKSEPLNNMDIENSHKKESQVILDNNFQDQIKESNLQPNSSPKSQTSSHICSVKQEDNQSRQPPSTVYYSAVSEDNQQTQPPATVQQDKKTMEEIQYQNELLARQQQENQLKQEIAKNEQELSKIQNEQIYNQQVLPQLQNELYNIAEQLKKIQQEINSLSFDQLKLKEAMRDTMSEFRYQKQEQFLINNDKFYFPINLNNTHWISIVVDTLRGKIYYLDSMSKSYRQDIIQGLFHIFQNYIHLDITQYRIESDSSQQSNAYDCGIFSILALLYTYQSSRPKNCEFKDIYSYSQTLVNEYRRRVLLDIAIIASQKKEFTVQDLEFIIENEI